MPSDQISPWYAPRGALAGSLADSGSLPVHAALDRMRATAISRDARREIVRFMQTLQKEG
ncbi:hypothetical protein [uncultured Aquimonas sp.]|uniref:hypothetical protein n=1 Tax=uncultured Aquimonas sp. TaxID=385483 RepID=UPI0026282991|nr:hypothetical protein [uncultured Aquimonas sp.]